MLVESVGAVFIEVRSSRLYRRECIHICIERNDIFMGKNETVKDNKDFLSLVQQAHALYQSLEDYRDNARNGQNDLSSQVADLKSRNEYLSCRKLTRSCGKKMSSYRKKIAS